VQLAKRSPGSSTSPAGSLASVARGRHKSTCLMFSKFHDFLKAKGLPIEIPVVVLRRLKLFHIGPLHIRQGRRELVKSHSSMWRNQRSTIGQNPGQIRTCDTSSTSGPDNRILRQCHLVRNSASKCFQCPELNRQIFRGVRVTSRCFQMPSCRAVIRRLYEQGHRRRFLSRQKSENPKTVPTSRHDASKMLDLHSLCRRPCCRCISRSCSSIHAVL
jgi:hypothetical protein